MDRDEMTSEEYQRWIVGEGGPSPSKYGNQRTTVGDKTFASKAEAQRYWELERLRDAGEIAWLQTQYPYDIVVNGRKICRYVADFRYWSVPEKRWIVEDVKGVKREAYVIKRRLMRAVLGIDVVEILV